MREIKFRGKRIDNGEWVYGDLRQVEEHAYMLDYDFGDNGVSDIVRIFDIAYSVIPETVGQYTGLKDKNGTEICEGDILKAYSNNSAYIGRVYYEDAQWFGACDFLGYAVAYSGAKVIGNIHDNPELLGGAE